MRGTGKGWLLPDGRLLLSGLLLVTTGGCDGLSKSSDKASNDPTVPSRESHPTPSNLPAACSGAVDWVPTVRASSLRQGFCDFGETMDSTVYDVLCPPGTANCTPSQSGDQLCHRVCSDRQCAGGEACQDRTVYVSDTPSRSALLCMCQGGACSPNTSKDVVVEAGLSLWRSETPMPIDLYGHAMAASDQHLFVSGGLHTLTRNPDGSGSAELVDRLYVADLAADGSITAWHDPLHLAAPITAHAMAVIGDRVYVAGGSTQDAQGRPSFISAVVSYAVAADGSLGEARSESGLPAPRGYHNLLVDPGGAGAPARLIVAGGGPDASFFTNGATEIWFADVSADGVIGAWSSVPTPDAFYYTGSTTLVAGSLFGFVTGHYNDRSNRALYGIRLADLRPGATQASFVRSAAWPYDPALLSEEEDVLLSGICSQLVVVGATGSVGTAPVDAAAHVGAFRAGTRFFGFANAAAVATTPGGRVYLSGGFGSAENGATVRSTNPVAAK